MDSVSYKLVYDAANQSTILIPFLLVWLIGIGVGIAAIIHSSKQNKKRGVAFSIFWLLGWTFISGLFNLIVTNSRATCKRLAKTGGYEIVEGIVEDFHPMPYGGNENESFTVNGKKFEYSDYLLSGGFNNTTSHGGPINEGLRVKIAYHDGDILKLWVEDKKGSTPDKK